MFCEVYMDLEVTEGKGWGGGVWRARCGTDLGRV